MAPIVPADAAGWGRALDTIRAGGVVALPTDTLYGLAADPFDEAALQRLLDLKRRAAAHPLPLLCPDPETARGLAASWPDAAERLAARWWPGALTLVVPGCARLPAPIVGPGGGVGLRVPDQPALLAMLAELGGPVTGTSANRTGGVPYADARAAARALGDDVDMVLDGGRLPLGPGSTVVACTGMPPRVLREGALRASDVLAP